jgi:hypothetical protein
MGKLGLRRAWRAAEGMGAGRSHPKCNMAIVVIRIIRYTINSSNSFCGYLPRSNLPATITKLVYESESGTITSKCGSVIEKLTCLFGQQVYTDNDGCVRNQH